VLLNKYRGCLLLGLFLIVTTGFIKPCQFGSQASAVTYELGHGRFGDSLVGYLHAKWISYRYKIPLLYKPFYYSTQLKLHEKELSYEECRKWFKNIIFLDKNNQIPIKTDNETLYVVPYFPLSIREQIGGHWTDFSKYIGVEWENEAFIEYIKEFVQPRYPLTRPVVLADKITVAVHVRRGGSFEPPIQAWYFPHKLPSDNFYIKALQCLDDILGHQPLYVFIFTDDQHPETIAHEYAQALGRSTIEFGYHKNESDHNINVLEDFFTMPLYDCLIHPDSNFSLCVAKLKRFMIRIGLGGVGLVDKEAKASSINVFLDKKSLGKKIDANLPLFSLSDTFTVPI
jgi:hypothetical protein